MITKEQRLEIIKKYPKDNYVTMEDFLGAVVFNEILFAGYKSYWKGFDIKEEIDKVLNLYSFEGISIPDRALSYAEHCLKSPESPAYDHVDINDGVSYLGEYYDGTPTSLLRKKDRYKINPIIP